MKVLKEVLLMNDLKSTLDIVEEETLIMRNEKEPVVMMSLENYNKLKEELYKKGE